MLCRQSLLRQPSDRNHEPPPTACGGTRKSQRRDRGPKQDAEARKELFFRRNQASAALRAYEKRAGEELKSLVNSLQKWSSSKNGTRLSYLSALHAIVCREKRVDSDRTVEIDSEGRIFLVEPFTQATGQLIERLIFVAQVTKSGEVLTERDEKGSPIVLERVRPFPFKAGRTEVRNAKVRFPETQQRPQLPHPESGAAG